MKRNKTKVMLEKLKNGIKTREAIKCGKIE
jgi:hypothetical protein